MKVLITEEQLKLIINEQKTIKLPKIVEIPSFCGGSLNNDGCKKYTATMAPYGKYANSSGPKHRNKFVYPASMEEVKYTEDDIPVIFVQKLNYGEKNNGRWGKGNKWKKNASKLYDRYINKKSIKDLGWFNNNKEFFDSTEIVRVTPANNHLFTHNSGSGDHPYENNNYVDKSAQPSLEAIGNVIGNFSYESTYRDAIHQQIMIDYNSPTAPIGMSNHQDGFAIDLPKSVRGTKKPKSPFDLEDSSSRVDKVFLFFVFIGPFYGWHPFGKEDTVHFTFCKGHSSSDCNQATGDYALGIKAFKESGDKLPDMLCGGGWKNDNINTATYQLGVKIGDTNNIGLGLIREWCNKWNGGEMVIPEPQEDELDPITTTVPPLGDVKIKGNNLNVNMGNEASQLGFQLFKKVGNKEEEIPYKKTNGNETVGGQTTETYKANESKFFSLPSFMSSSMMRTLPGTLLFVKVSRVMNNLIVPNTTKQTEDFTIDFQGNILTGSSEIDNFYKINKNVDPKYTEEYLDIEQDRIMRGIDNTYVKPNTIPIDLPKIEFKKD